MHAVIAIFTTDQEQQERDLAFLRERIVPAVSREPGFVAGYRTNDGEHSYNMIIFDSREAARGQGRRRARKHRRPSCGGGIIAIQITIAEVPASALEATG
jgi:hypothetical protein